MLKVIKVRLPKAAAAACAAAALALALTLPSPVSARTVTDDNGDRVEVPEKIERAVVTNIFPMASAVAVYTGRGDVIKGMHPSSWAAAKSGLLGEVFPDVLKADHAFMKGASVNLEALMALEPDVVLVNAADRRTIDMLRSAELAAYAVSTTKWDYDAMATFDAWMTSLGNLFPEADPEGAKKAALKAEVKRLDTLVRERTKDVKTDERPRAMFVVRMDERQIVTSGKRFFGDYWIREGEGRNVAEGVTGENANAVVSMEQVYAWDPEVVFLTNFTPVMPEDLLKGDAGKTSGQDWSEVAAVKTGRVFKMPLGFYRTFTPSAETPFTRLWVAAKLHPERFADVDLALEAKRFYRNAFGIELTDRQIEGILNPGAAAGQGAGTNIRGR